MLVKNSGIVINRKVTKRNWEDNSDVKIKIDNKVAVVVEGVTKIEGALFEHLLLGVDVVDSNLIRRI